MMEAGIWRYASIVFIADKRVPVEDYNEKGVKRYEYKGGGEFILAEAVVLGAQIDAGISKLMKALQEKRLLILPRKLLTIKIM